MSHSSNPVVLFVDDEPQTLHAYRSLLRREPYDILTAGSARQALELLRRNHVDILVADERMPVMSGSELLQRVQLDYPDVTRIMLSGEASLETSVRAIKGGLYQFLSKPIEPDDLRRVIAAALGSKGFEVAHSLAAARA